MRIVVVGAEGDIGKAVCAELESRHEIIRAGRSSGDIRVDMANRASVDAMYASCGKVDAVVSTAGDVHFSRLHDYTEESFMLGLRHKVLGQVNLVLAGLDIVNEAGSFTLTSGVLDRDPIRTGAAAARANGALGGFVVGAAIEMPRGLRINVVSPGLLDVSVPRYGEWFPATNLFLRNGSVLPTRGASREPSPER
ncbi:short chain dehydrogenase [Mesorhizobium sp. CA4]|uniref:short chain dehydrogenase n=1 Tax=Mesorhizobium sp. CA4 TaxID=588499 RepID=UPI001CD0E279|nr:short chain dehydrogenase [Mesorhizobium sp. CA4]MBZ9823224.1 short chain dehydrogenase [Mesorhizobium sp. CA4]